MYRCITLAASRVSQTVKYFTVLKSASSMVTTRTWLGNTTLSFDRRNPDPNFAGCYNDRKWTSCDTCFSTYSAYSLLHTNHWKLSPSTSCVATYIFFQLYLKPTVHNSFSRSLYYVFFGCHLLVWPSSVHSSMTMMPSVLLNLCPGQFHFLLLSWSSKNCWSDSYLQHPGGASCGTYYNSQARELFDFINRTVNCLCNCLWTVCLYLHILVLSSFIFFLNPSEAAVAFKSWIFSINRLKEWDSNARSSA